MKAVVLAGGFGTRLRPVLSDRPKPMAPVLGKPFLEYLIRFIREQGITEIVLCLYYLADKIVDYFGDGSRLGVNIEYSVEDEPLGTAGALKNSGRYLTETFYVLNGDTYLEIDLRKLLRYHRARRGLATISLVRNLNPERYGSVKVSGDGRVLGFVEKTYVNSRKAAYVNAGVYLFEPRILGCIPDGVEVSLEKEVFPALIKSGEPIYGFLATGYFIDIGIPEDYLRLQKEVRGLVEGAH